MIRHTSKFILMTVAAVLLGPTVLGGNGPGESELVLDRMMVGLAEGATIDAFIEAFESDPANGGAVLCELESIPNHGAYLLCLNTPPGFSYELLDDRLGTEYAEQIIWGDLLYDADAPEGSNGQTGSTYVDSVSPPEFGGQYIVDKINLNTGHDFTTGLGVTVGIIDSGIDPTHPLFAEGLLDSGWDFVDGDASPLDEIDGIDSDGDGEADEMVGHGTFVAGLVRLVAPDARILPIRVLNSDGRTDNWRILQGIYYAIDHGVEVINISIRSTYDTQGVESAIEEAAELGIITVAAAGNFNIDRREFPAAKSDAIGVTSVDDFDIKSDFSTYNDKVDLSAPGDSAFKGGQPVAGRAVISALPGGDYGAWEGTSMAAPLVAGAAALIRSQHPEWPANLMTNQFITDRLTGTAVDIYDLNPAFADDEQLGAGRLDVGAAVNIGGTPPPLGDLNGDDLVNTTDLLNLLEQWGATHTSADLNGDGTVDVMDLLIQLGNWG